MAITTRPNDLAGPLCSANITTSPVFLPGAGRDEALYWYWSHHHEPAYAPLLQVLVNIFGQLPLPPLQGLRITVLILGLAVIWQLDWLLRRYHFPPQRRRWLLLALALSPWQTYTGATLHPDMFMVATLLAFSICVFKRRYTLAAVFAGLGIWVKPSGELLAIIAALLFLTDTYTGRHQRWLYSAVALTIPLPVLFFLNGDMITAIAEFGRMGSSVSLLEILVVQLCLLALLGGPALCLSAAMGAGSGIREALTRGLNWAISAPLHHKLPMLAAGAFLGAFCSASAITGQVKGNWMLPAFVMLLPLTGNTLPLRWLKGLVIVSGIISAGIAGLLQFPGIAITIESAYPNLGKTYTLQAGTREARVSATASWSNRVNEYQSLEAFAEHAAQYWHAGNAGAYPDTIITDDYGLAAQLLFTWQQTGIRLQVINDGIFSRQNVSGNNDPPGSKVLIMAVQQSPDSISDRTPEALRIETFPHPYAQRPVQLAMLITETP